MGSFLTWAVSSPGSFHHPHLGSDHEPVRPPAQSSTEEGDGRASRRHFTSVHRAQWELALVFLELTLKVPAVIAAGPSSPPHHHPGLGFGEGQSPWEAKGSLGELIPQSWRRVGGRGRDD